jgi:hypothetical protein
MFLLPLIQHVQPLLLVLAPQSPEGTSSGLGVETKVFQEKPLADWITATGVGFVGQDRVDKEDERVERNDGWQREPCL